MINARTTELSMDLSQPYKLANTHTLVYLGHYIPILAEREL